MKGFVENLMAMAAEEAEELQNEIKIYSSMPLDEFRYKKRKKRIGVVDGEIRTEQKIGRNEKCPCGSGNKYKKCCLKQK